MKAVDKYCDSVVTELGAWKSKIYDVVRKIEKLPSGDKAKMVNQVNDLHIFVDELEQRIDRLRHECPIDWKPDQVELETKMTHLKTTYKQVWDNVSPGDIGG